MSTLSRRGNNQNTAVYNAVRNYMQSQGMSTMMRSAYGYYDAKPKRAYNKKPKAKKAKAKTKTKSNSKLSAEVKTLKKGLRSLKCEASQSIGTCITRKLAYSQLLSLANVQKVSVVSLGRKSDYEAALVDLKYYDPSAPATLISGDFTAGTYSKEVCFRTIHGTALYKNNFLVPVDITVYLCEPRGDTSINPSSAWLDGIQDSPSNASSVEDLNQFASDYDTFTKLWKITKVIDQRLSAGQSCQASHTIKDVDYSPAYGDVHSLEYQSKNLNSAAFMCVIKGVLGHVGINPCISAAGIDIQFNSKYEVDYDAGCSINYTLLSTNAVYTATTGLVSMAPIADNQSYSPA